MGFKNQCPSYETDLQVSGCFDKERADKKAEEAIELAVEKLFDEKRALLPTFWTEVVGFLGQKKHLFCNHIQVPASLNDARQYLTPGNAQSVNAEDAVKVYRTARFGKESGEDKEDLKPTVLQVLEALIKSSGKVDGAVGAIWKAYKYLKDDLRGNSVKSIRYNKNKKGPIQVVSEKVRLEGSSGSRVYFSSHI